MKHTVLFFSLLMVEVCSGQKSLFVSSNESYFQSDEKYSALSISKRKIKSIRVLHTRSQTDSAQVEMQYNFDLCGYLTSAIKTDDRYSPSEYFQVDTNGFIVEHLRESEGKIADAVSLVVESGRVVRKIKHRTKFLRSYCEYKYGDDELVDTVLCFNVDGNAESYEYFKYDVSGKILKRVMGEFADSSEEVTEYEYDDSGRVTGELNSTAGGQQKIQISYFGKDSVVSTKIYLPENDHSLIIVEHSSPAVWKMDVYYGTRLQETHSRKFSANGKLLEEISDRRMTVKKRRKTNHFCGYTGPPPYEKVQYEYAYDSDGNCVLKKTITDGKLTSKIAYSYSGGLLVKEMTQENNDTKEIIYEYIYY